MIGIYEIEQSSTDKRYIGSSVRVERRLVYHRNRLRNNKHTNPYLQASWNKYKEDDFSFNPILICSKENLEFYEDLVIRGYQSNKAPLGFNLRTVSRSNLGVRNHKQKIGDTYNRLTFIEPTNTVSKFGETYWLCKCVCGVIKEYVPLRVRSGAYKILWLFK